LKVRTTTTGGLRFIVNHREEEYGVELSEKQVFVLLGQLIQRFGPLNPSDSLERGDVIVDP
jgi:hypothetical protein